MSIGINDITVVFAIIVSFLAQSHWADDVESRNKLSVRLILEILLHATISTGIFVVVTVELLVEAGICIVEREFHVSIFYKDNWYVYLAHGGHLGLSICPATAHSTYALAYGCCHLLHARKLGHYLLLIQCALSDVVGQML